MIKANYGDKQLVVDILSKSFENNQSVNYIANSGNGKSNRIRYLMDYSFEVCHQFGDIYLSDDRHAVALILYPETKKTNLSSIFLDVKLILNCIGVSNIGKVTSPRKTGAFKSREFGNELLILNGRNIHEKIKVYRSTDCLCHQAG